MISKFFCKSKDLTFFNKEFSPIKNKEGPYDTPLTAYRMYSEFNIKEIEKFGIQVKRNSVDDYLQISPKYFYNQKELLEFLKSKKITVIDLPSNIE